MLPVKQYITKEGGGHSLRVKPYKTLKGVGDINFQFLHYKIKMSDVYTSPRRPPIRSIFFITGLSTLILDKQRNKECLTK